MRKKLQVVITCEHGGNEIPRHYAPLFRSHKALLKSHRGYDAGALELSHRFKRACHALHEYSETSRLLVDLNRSIGHPKLHFDSIRALSKMERNEILKRHYFPHREKVQRHIASIIKRGSIVVHLGVHSFTPRLNGVVRNADIGLLYDPKRTREVELCRTWSVAIESSRRSLRVRRNYPYRGTNDGFIPYLRKCFKPTQYIGVELEVNQKLVNTDRAKWLQLQHFLVQSFSQSVRLCTKSLG